jgi:phosphoglycolate phosphatase
LKLKELAKYGRIIIQCHDTPDADAIASGFALQRFLSSQGANAELVYGGAAEIQKPSLLLMLEMLGIEISRVMQLPHNTGLLITVDCQRGAGNVQSFDLPENAAVAVLDHHRPEIEENDNTVIRPSLASCSTLIWDMLRKEGHEMDAYVQNALYYGLFTDTNGFSELRHPLDRDLAELTVDMGVIRKLKYSAITAGELDIVAAALRGRESVGSVGVFRAESCDSNLLGFIGDIAQQVAQMDCCIVYCRQSHGVKLSIRSSAREIMASEVAEFLCRGIGSGGGNVEKAGGFISAAGIQSASNGSGEDEYLKNRLREYLAHYDLIYAGDNDICFGAMPLFRKLPRPVGFAKSTDIFPEGAKITVRTLEGDVDTVAGDDIYLMIGIQGETYPIKRDRFETDYRVSDEPYAESAEYIPSIINRVTGEKKEILPFAKTCVPGDDKLVRAKILEKAAKVFAHWDAEKYFYGDAGDYLVAGEGNYDDCYIVRGTIFQESYGAAL